MNYIGDFLRNTTVWFLWATNDSNGASVTRSTDGTIKVMRSDDTIITTGITDTEDSPLTGVHNCSIDLSANEDYAIGYDYVVYLEGAVIDGQTVNFPLRHFSIENRTSILNALGVTEGGAWTLAKAIKIMTAWTAGTWQDKSGETRTKQLLDPDDQTTVILEMQIDDDSPQRTIEVKI